MSGRSSRFQLSNLLLLAPASVSILALWKLDFIWLEALLLVLILAAVAIAGKRLKWSARPPAWCGFLRRASRNAVVACTLPALASVVLRVALLPWIPIPHPVVPDEYSHIFLAKTFLLGRLANPAHPLWEHFESIHILSQPTFSSMYMAGQACFLAAGQLLFGNLFWGVVLSTALFCGVLTWFLRAYVPPGWALYGGLLAAVRIGAASYWNNSYWGGSAGALGGAMVLGAYPRLVKSWKPLPAIVFAAGLVLLANTRPYEGAVLGLALGLALVRDLYRSGRFGTLPWKRVMLCVAAAAIVLGVSGWAMTRHWKAVTGSAFTLPYQVNQRVYGWPMTLPWLSVPAVQYRHPEFALYRDFEIGEHQFVTVPSQIPYGLVVKYAYWWGFFFGISLSAAFLFAGKILSARRTRVAWAAGAAVVLAVLTEQSGYPHYLAPAAPVLVLFIVQGFRYLVHWRAGAASFGPAIVRAVVPVFCALLAARAATMSPRSEPGVSPNLFSWCCTDVRQKDREPIVQKLQAIPGIHLVIVTYDLTSYDTSEWVYNEPDIDQARIVFARDMGPAKNQELIRYYPGRRVWRLLVQKDGVVFWEPEIGR
jgi:hypothetical protein